MTNHLYTSEIIWTGAAKTDIFSYESYCREYQVNIPDKPSFLGSADPTFHGDPSLYNPEDLLLVALSACHLLSYLALCARKRIQVISYQDNPVGTMAEKGGKTKFTEVILYPQVVIESREKLEKAIQLHHTAHEVCFIANSVNFPVLNQPVVAVKAN